MTEICRTRISGPSAWRGADVADARSRWEFELSAEDLDEFDAALDKVHEAGLEIDDITVDNFHLPRFTEKIDRILGELEDGVGFVLVRGLPVHARFSEERAAEIFWAIGQYMGGVVSQNDRGHMLGHVRDLREASVEARDPNRRQGYERGGPLRFHCDQADAVGLLCLRKAISGGESLIVSSAEVHNVIRDERPDLLDVLYRTFYADRKNEHGPDEAPYFLTPVFSYLDGKLSAKVKGFIKDAQRLPEVPRLTDEESEALDFLDSVALRPELSLSMTLEEGDMQFLNNWSVIHSRTDYVDHDDLDLRRHLLRLWINVKNGRPLVPDLEAQRRGVAPVNA